MKKSFTLFFFLISLYSTAQVNLTDGLVAYYPFNGDTKDYSGNLYDLTATDVTPVKDKDGNAASAYSFNGTSSKMEPASPLEFWGTSSMSVSVWMKSNNKDLKYLLSASDFGIATEGTTAYMTIKILGEVNGAGGTFAKSEWTHLVGTYDGTNIKLYVNNILASTKYYKGDLLFSTQQLQLGHQSPSFYWPGELDELVLYSRILNKKEIEALYNSTKPVTGIADAKIEMLNGIYPVPATSEIQIPSDVVTENTVANILKADGTTVITTELEGAHLLSINSLPQGIYMLQLVNDKSTFTGRFVKE